MDILILIFALIGAIEIIIAFCIDWDNEDVNSAMLSSGITLCVVAIVCIIFMLIKGEQKIEPIEVYRGNTVLQVTYQDSIPIDSVVVYKNK